MSYSLTIGILSLCSTAHLNILFSNSMYQDRNILDYINWQHSSAKAYFGKIVKNYRKNFRTFRHKTDIHDDDTIRYRQYRYRRHVAIWTIHQPISSIHFSRHVKRLVTACTASVLFNCWVTGDRQLKVTKNDYIYLRQVNEVNGGDSVMCSFDVCVCPSVRSGRSWELNANSSKTVTATDFKFDTSLLRDSPDMTPKNFSKRGVVRVTWPLNFSALNANNSKTIKATDLKFDTSLNPRDSPDATPKNLSKGGRG